ncbi:nitrogen fixation protein NifZ [Roseospira marina]|uniref:Nitrogen fixation protein NifZ n=1 Tax=Roseospira marina TaxID=140057 RepID=A0A5M6IH49_9PROT|nr:nitrogen fixation protein NifZ [Roseospira marina]KAA5607613.1 nitrogen fixation protein NifZ [Roseospira marina]MBB4312191.1 nitrogen fixation protein NifZ [Roseospira marina]MBB5085793.1 nitrogen fixation protein NifZ [Roseospira marina]
MSTADDGETTGPLEIDLPPAFQLGEKVRATALVRNDGTFPGLAVGDVLVQPGNEGYVRDIGSFLQRYRIYAVDFIGLNRIVGLRAGELESAERAETRERSE